jgi:hypothetical protein
VAEIAEPTNARRDICDLLVMLSSSELLNIETFPASDAQIRGAKALARRGGEPTSFAVREGYPRAGNSEIDACCDGHRLFLLS